MLKLFLDFFFFVIFSFPPICVCFAANSSAANESQVYLLQHDKSSRRHADAGLVENQMGTREQENKKYKKKNEIK